MAAQAGKSRPIIFDGESVKAILAGNKTQTRRVVKPQPDWIESSARWRWPIPKRAQRADCSPDCVTASREWHEYMPPGCCPYGAPGDELWVRETFQFEDASEYGLAYADAPEGPVRTFESGRVLIPRYRATAPDTVLEVVPNDTGDPDQGMRWGGALLMPRWASRITLRVTDVRVERLQEITDADCEAEGVRPSVDGDGHDWRDDENGWHRTFRQRWNRINARRGFSWESNPWVWAVSFDANEAAVASKGE